MNKVTKAAAAVLAAVMLAFAAASCAANVPANTVFSKDDLPGKKIGVQMGTTGDIFASDYEKEDSTVERYTKGLDAVQALKQGKIDCVIIDEEPAKVFVEKNAELKILDDSFDKEEYAIALKKDNTELRDKINKALAELKADGTIQKIIDNYIGDDTKGSYKYASPEGTKRDNGKLVMATNAQFPPYEYTEGNNIVGIDADMAQAVADKLGMELKIEDMKFDAIITAVTTGKADIGVAGLTVTEDRLKNVAFTDTYASAKQVIIVRSK